MSPSHREWLRRENSHVSKKKVSTLGLTTVKTIHTVLSKSEDSRNFSDISDKIGKRIPGNKISNDISGQVNSHVLSFNPNIIHCSRKHPP